MVNLMPTTSRFIPYISNFTTPVSEFERILSNQKEIMKGFTPEEKILFESYGYFLEGIDFFAGKEKVDKALGDAYQKLEKRAKDLFKREQKEINREKDPGLKELKNDILRLSMGEAVQKVVAIYNENIHKAKELLNMFDAQKCRLLSEKVLRYSSEREIYTQQANKILQDSGITDFALNDDYLALLVRSDKRNSTLTVKEQKILSDYRDFEREALSKLNKLQRQAYNDSKKYALGMEKLRCSTAKQRKYFTDTYNRLVKTHHAEDAEKLLNLRED